MNYLSSASVDVTYRCNLRCRHCFDFSGECAYEEMNDDELISVFRQLALIDLSSICICGGEPILRFDLIRRAVRLVKELNQGTLVSMVSNGILWTEEIADALKRDGLDLVQFSLDGLSDASYDHVRLSNGKLHRVLDAIKIARRHGIRVAVASLPHARNIKEYPSIISFCEKEGVSDFRAQPLMPLGRGELNYKDLCLTPEQNDALAAYLSARNAVSQMQITWGDPVDHLYMYRETGRIPQICVNAYGELSVSPYLPITIWNLNRNTLRDYIDLEIDRYALRHPIVEKCLARIEELSDFTSIQQGLPVLFKERNIDISQELEDAARVHGGKLRKSS